jgi:hypothetical protein
MSRRFTRVNRGVGESVLVLAEVSRATTLPPSVPRPPASRSSHGTPGQGASERASVWRTVALLADGGGAGPPGRLGLSRRGTGKQPEGGPTLEAHPSPPSAPHRRSPPGRTDRGTPQRAHSSRDLTAMHETANLMAWSATSHAGSSASNYPATVRWDAARALPKGELTAAGQPTPGRVPINSC